MDPIPLPEPLGSDLQAYLGDVQHLGELTAQATEKQAAADQASQVSQQAAAAVTAQQATVAESRGKVNADLDALTNRPQFRRGAGAARPAPPERAAAQQQGQPQPQQGRR